MASTSNLTGTIVHLLILCTYIYAISATGFTTDLIPSDSPLSPFFSPKLNRYDRLQNAMQRSLKRIRDFNSKTQAPLRHGDGIAEYVMRVSLGTPPVELLAIADTGSDLTWTQCLPCTQCFPQTLPLFDPNRSSSYKPVSCGSDTCNSIPTGTSCGQHVNISCIYSYGYVDGSYTKGDLATETFTIGNSSDPLPNVVFGCGHVNNGTVFLNMNGIVGLGGGSLSMVSQLGGVNGRKFSYCLTLPNANVTSKISFGSDAVVSGPGFVSTPIVKKIGQETFYFLTFQGLSVGDKRIDAFASPSDDGGDDEEGNIVIDSGTSFTFLPSDVVKGLVSALKEVIRLPVVDAPFGNFQLCFAVNGDDHKIDIPVSVTVHFKGADVVLQPNNMFTVVADGMICLTILPAGDMAFFGNMAQKNMLVGYDLDAHVVSFKPTDCSKQQ